MYVQSKKPPSPVLGNKVPDGDGVFEVTRDMQSDNVGLEKCSKIFFVT